MNTKQTRALGRLTKKLSALRQTLGRDERALLDIMVLGAPVEVEGHAFMTAAKPAVKDAAKAEVEGHALRTAAKAAVKDAAKAEVEGHALRTAAKDAVKDAAKAEVEGHVLFTSVREAIFFDAAKGAYVLAKAD